MSGGFFDVRGFKFSRPSPGKSCQASGTIQAKSMHRQEIMSHRVLCDTTEVVPFHPSTAAAKSRLIWGLNRSAESAAPPENFSRKHARRRGHPAVEEVGVLRLRRVMRLAPDPAALRMTGFGPGVNGRGRPSLHKLVLFGCGCGVCCGRATA